MDRACMFVALLGISTPVFVVGIGASVLEVSSADYLRTAQAKGLPEGTIVFKHLIKNATIPIFTLIGLSLAD